jgi:hypothetical protein
MNFLTKLTAPAQSTRRYVMTTQTNFSLKTHIPKNLEKSQTYDVATAKEVASKIIVLNWDKELVELNANESAVYKCFLQGGDEYEDRMCLHSTQIYVDGLSEPQIKGYLSALAEKDVISKEELPSKVYA